MRSPGTCVWYHLQPIGVDDDREEKQNHFSNHVAGSAATSIQSLRQSAVSYFEIYVHNVTEKRPAEAAADSRLHFG